MIRRIFDLNALPRRMFAAAVLMLAIGYGIAADRLGLFPVPLIESAMTAGVKLVVDSGIRKPWYFRDSGETTPARTVDAQTMSPGLTLVTVLAADGDMRANVVDANARVIQGWRLNWSNMWPNATHLSPGLLPKSDPTLVHGTAVMPNGDLVFSFQGLGMLRVDACGEVVWRLPYRTHHSVHVDDRGHLWTSGVITRHEKVEKLANHNPPFEDYTVVEISPDGRILMEASVLELLADSGLRGLLHLSTKRTLTTVFGDTLHVNDVETFPESLVPGVFQPGDVMISLRNINAIAVFDSKTRKVKFVSVGRVIRQHDPDFVDGNTISVLDNNNLGVGTRFTGPGPTERLSLVTPNGHYSRVVRMSATGGEKDVDVRFKGTDERPFFTDIMGTHQLLSNGNTLITESAAGRVFEIDLNGRIVWEFFNIVGEGVVGIVPGATRLPVKFDEAFFAQAIMACRNPEGVARAGNQ